MIGTIIPPVVVLDATGVVGRGVVAAALQAGRPVIAVGTDPAALDALARRSGPGMTTLAGSARDEAAAARLADGLRALRRPVGGVIVPLQPLALRGRALDLPAQEACRHFESALCPQLAAARHLLPLLAEGGRGAGYVLIGGPGGDHPWAGYGHSSVVEAALRMLARVLHGEAHALGVRLQLLSVQTPAWGVHAGPPRPDWPSALEIGQGALRLLDGASPTDPVVQFAHGAAPAHGPAPASAPGARDLDDARHLLDAALPRSATHPIPLAARIPAP